MRLIFIFDVARYECARHADYEARQRVDMRALTRRAMPTPTFTHFALPFTIIFPYLIISA